MKHYGTKISYSFQLKSDFDRLTRLPKRVVSPTNPFITCFWNIAKYWLCQTKIKIIPFPNPWISVLKLSFPRCPSTNCPSPFTSLSLSKYPSYALSERSISNPLWTPFVILYDTIPSKMFNMYFQSWYLYYEYTNHQKCILKAQASNIWFYHIDYKDKSVSSKRILWVVRYFQPRYTYLYWQLRSVKKN